jgi:hypothetical protein
MNVGQHRAWKIGHRHLGDLQRGRRAVIGVHDRLVAQVQRAGVVDGVGDDLRCPPLMTGSPSS